MNDQTDILKTLYAQGCSALQYYSGVVQRYKAIVLIQGLFILSANLLLIQKKAYLFSLGCSFIGISFTIIMALCAKHYTKSFDRIHEQVIEMEKKLLEDQEQEQEKKSPNITGVWTIYDEIKSTTEMFVWTNIIVLYGPAMVIGAAFMLLIICSFFSLLFQMT